MWYSLLRHRRRREHEWFSREPYVTSREREKSFFPHIISMAVGMPSLLSRGLTEPITLARS